MKILAPTNSANEVSSLISAGADELYCGVITKSWREKYTNIGSPNRREWSSANLGDYRELKKIVNIAHESGVSVWMTLNAFYTRNQEEIIKQEIQNAHDAGVDGFIVADLGIMDYLKSREEFKKQKLIVSTCATSFNSWSIEFYKRFSPFRITLPRQLTLEEIRNIKANHSDMDLEVFVLNSGCKNIDGFCTFHHGVSEHTLPFLWNILKKANLDLKILEKQRKYPFLLGLNKLIKGVDSACILDYKIEIQADVEEKQLSKIKSNIRKYFSLDTGIDPCRVCEVFELIKSGIEVFKIVGRNYQTVKKVKDIKFLKAAIELAQDSTYEGYETTVRELFKEIYNYPCAEICYQR
ncbi:MAG: U32 family peptidase [Candidatus Saelkia tenebricola]|nr:U32 family peptidase [Candidatus Saelkia tenebricola]